MLKYLRGRNVREAKFIETVEKPKRYERVYYNAENLHHSENVLSALPNSFMIDNLQHRIHK